MRTLEQDAERKRKEYQENPEKHRARQKRWNDKRRAMVAEIKLASGCVDCGYREHAAALDFDHVRGVKKRGVAFMLRSSWESILEEIAKCEVRCANCHRVKTHLR